MYRHPQHTHLVPACLPASVQAYISSPLTPLSTLFTDCTTTCTANPSTPVFRTQWRQPVVPFGQSCSAVQVGWLAVAGRRGVVGSRWCPFLQSCSVVQVGWLTSE